MKRYQALSVSSLGSLTISRRHLAFWLFSLFVGCLFVSERAVDSVAGFQETPKRSQFRLPQAMPPGVQTFQNKLPQVGSPKNSLGQQSTHTLNSQTGSIGKQKLGPASPTDNRLKNRPGCLNGVAFLDEKIGIVVGDGGLIWRTVDGGQSWSQSKSQTRSNLYTVKFVDQNTVIAAGGHSLPVESLSQGVVLRSHDQGKTWTITDAGFLPRVTELQLQNQSGVWAATGGDLRNLLGIFESIDSGASWTRFFCDANRANHRWTPEKGYRKGNSRIYRPASRLNSKGRAKGTLVSNGRFWVASSGNRVFVGKETVTEEGKFQLAAGQSPPQLVDICFSDFRECIAVDSDGSCWRSTNRGKDWQILFAGGSVLQAKRIHLSSVVAAGKRLIFGLKNENATVCFDLSTNKWTVNELQMPVPANDVYFTNHEIGFAVGDLGNVAKTVDGGRSWQWVFRTHPRVTTLLVASHPEDVPLELITKLSLNQGHTVGLLTTENTEDFFRYKDALSLQALAVWIQDSDCTDPSRSTERKRQKIASWLDRLKPQVVILCPEGIASAVSKKKISRRSQINTGTVIEACRQISASNKFDRNYSGIQLLQLSQPGIGEIDFATTAMSRALQRSYLGYCLPAYKLLRPVKWDIDQIAASEIPKKDTFSFRPVASIGRIDSSWWKSGSASTKWYVRPIRRSGQANFSTMTTQSKKSAWIQYMKQLPDKTAKDRANWLNQMYSARAQITPPVFARWLADLATEMRRERKFHFASVAAIQAWDLSENSDYALPEVLLTLENLISTERQWRNREEIQKEKEKELLQANLEVEQDTDPEAVKKRIYRKYGITEEELDRVPPEVHQKIMLMEDALAGDRKALEAYRKMVTVPKPTVSITSSSSKTLLGQNAKTTEIIWGKPDENVRELSLEEIQESIRDSVNMAQGRGVQTVKKIPFDRPRNVRAGISSRLISEIETKFPQVSGYPKWWLIKAATYRAAEDREKNLFAHKSLNQLLLSHGYRNNDSRSPLNGEGLDWAIVQQVYWKSNSEKQPISVLVDGKGIQRVSFERNKVGQNRIDASRVLNCGFSDQPPFLDGNFNDPCWSGEIPPGSRSFVATRNDLNYLYIAIRLTRKKNGFGKFPVDLASFERKGGKSIGSGDREYSRDSANLENGFTFKLDVDGDRLQSYDILIDEDGRISEKAAGDMEWNPEIYSRQKKFSAEDPTMETYQIEMAISLEDLTDFQTDHPWTMSILKNQKSGLRQKIGTWWIQTAELGIGELDDMDFGGTPAANESK